MDQQLKHLTQLSLHEIKEKVHQEISQLSQTDNPLKSYLILQFIGQEICRQLNQVQPEGLIAPLLDESLSIQKQLKELQQTWQVRLTENQAIAKAMDIKEQAVHFEELSHQIETLFEKQENILERQLIQRENEQFEQLIS